MKPFNLLLIIAVFMSLPSMAQTKVKRHYIMLSVYDNYSLIPHSTKNVLITREDGTQDIKISKSSNDYSLNHFKANEDSIFVLLLPYLKDGWNIASCNTIPIPNGGSALSDYLTRYILFKEEQD